MTLAEAKSRLEVMVAHSDDPVLTSGELDLLLADNQVDDATWDLYRAAAEGWRWKAGRVAARFDVADEAAQAKRSQLYEHCRSQAREYDARAGAPGATGTATARPLSRFSC